MKRYCFDTSGFSTPVERMPDDNFRSLWHRVTPIIEAGEIAVTTEIYEEMHGSIRGTIGACIDANKAGMLLEVDDPGWDAPVYRTIVTEMQLRHRQFISEYTGGSAKTVGLADISIVALAKALNLAVVAEEKAVSTQTSTKRKIPDVCRLEEVECLTFNEFLRREGISL